jgi:hypothetical protein
VKEVTAIPPEGDARAEVDVRGALLRLRTNAGQIYIVRVQPHCVYSGDLAIEIQHKGDTIESSLDRATSDRRSRDS